MPNYPSPAARVNRVNKEMHISIKYKKRHFFTETLVASIGAKGRFRTKS